jgi:hypothetical protein
LITGKREKGAGTRKIVSVETEDEQTVRKLYKSPAKDIG